MLKARTPRLKKVLTGWNCARRSYSKAEMNMFSMNTARGAIEP
jgi:hypothetical protein